MPRRKNSKIETCPRPKDLEKMIKRLLSDNPSHQLESTTKFGKILSSGRNPHVINEKIQSIIVPRFIKFLQKERFPDLQHEAVCVLANIACENAEVVIEHGAVPILVKYLASSPSEYFIEQAVRALGNVAGDSKESRDYVVRCGALLSLLPQLCDHIRLSIRRCATWTTAVLCRDQPELPLDQVKRVLVALEQVLRTLDEELLKNACWALFHLSYRSENRIQSVIEAGFVPRLVQLLQHFSLFVVVPALRSLGNIVTGSIQQTQCVINSGTLPIIAYILTQDYYKIVKRDACWMISNITAGTEEQIQMVINENLIPTLVNLAQDTDIGIKQEALMAISNATLMGSHDQIKYLVRKSCIKPLCDNLESENQRIKLACLNGLEKILKMGEAEKNIRDYRQMIIDAEGQEKIENLQRHDHHEIWVKAFKILEKYWLQSKPPC